MSVRYEREEEFLSSAFKRVGGGLRDVQRATGTERAQTMETVIEMVPVVADALEKAQQAINDAADAVTTSNGKNARRRGKTEPAPPGGGWVAGDQWIVDNDDGDPVEVRVWDGTEFVHEQLLAAELLILSGGVIRLADGTVTADALVADAIDGMTITGALIRTAPSGQRMQFDVNGLRAFDASNAVTAALYSSFGGFRLSGDFIVSDAGGTIPRSFIGRESIQVLSGADVGGYPGVRGTVEPGLIRATQRKEKLSPSGENGDSIVEHKASDSVASSEVFYRPPSVTGVASSSMVKAEALPDRARIMLRDQSMPTSAAVIEARGGTLYVGDGNAPVDLVAGGGIHADGKIVLGDRLRGDATKMNVLHTSGKAYDGLKFWRTDLNVEYVYVGGQWLPNSEIVFTSSTLSSIISLVTGTTIDGSSWLRKTTDGTVYGTLAFYRAAGFTSGATFATLAVGYRPGGGDQLPAVMWGAGSPGRAHFQMGGAANGVLIVWSPPASTQYVSAKVMYRAI